MNFCDRSGSAAFEKQQNGGEISLKNKKKKKYSHGRKKGDVQSLFFSSLFQFRIGDRELGLWVEHSNEPMFNGFWRSCELSFELKSRQQHCQDQGHFHLSIGLTRASIDSNAKGNVSKAMTF
jgi:hypothetical protein